MMKNLMSEFIARFLSIDSKKDNKALQGLLLNMDAKQVSGGSGSENGERPRKEVIVINQLIEQQDADRLDDALVNLVRGGSGTYNGDEPRGANTDSSVKPQTEVVLTNLQAKIVNGGGSGTENGDKPREANNDSGNG
ncbi:hypothetical protein [Pseudoalteromonas sp. OANN1]|uniref:hypothetical protein n=1 Tax=Pseudoalteromonas sp. OANN1 TaxID=2954497 RepID=UPI0020985BC1|nr:hypothetical protein [Pseudoalteromonas sp. OANN1]MCO7198411.1 hypothetical protein [Pseudoalteromonas sp. OANN1]